MNKTARELLHAFIDGYNERDLKALLSMHTSDVNLWGTGIDEYRVGLKALEAQLLRDWSQAEKGHIKLVSMVPSGDESWAACVCHVTLQIEGQEHKFDDLRCTIVVRKEDGVAKIAHSHSSFPDMRNPENGSFPVR